MAQEIKKFMQGQKLMTHYAMGNKDIVRPLQNLLKIGALAGATLFNAACTSLPSESQSQYNMVLGPEVADVAVTQQDKKYSEKLTQVEQRMNGYIGADKIKFMKPDMFKKYQGQTGLFGQSLMAFKEKIVTLLPKDMAQDGVHNNSVGSVARAYMNNSPEAHDVYTWASEDMAACLIVPAKDANLFQFTPEIYEDLGQHIQLSGPQRMAFANYHEAWHCVESQLYGQIDQSDRKETYMQTYKSENFGDIGAAVEMIKDGHDATVIIDGVKQARAFRLLSNPIDVNAEENMAHYTMPTLNALEGHIEQNGVDAIKKMSPEETLRFVKNIVEDNVLDAVTLRAAVGLSVSQPRFLYQWRDAYTAEAGITDPVAQDKIIKMAQEMQQSVMQQVRKINPDKQDTYKFQQPVSVHLPKIYEDPFKGLMEQLAELDKGVQKPISPASPNLK